MGGAQRPEGAIREVMVGLVIRIGGWLIGSGGSFESNWPVSDDELLNRSA